MCGRSNCFNSKICCCLCSFYSFLISLAFIFFIYWHTIFPKELKFIVTDASLKRFDLSNTANSTLFYDLDLNILVKNPNKKVVVYFDHVEVFAIYRKRRFSTAILNSETPFYLGLKNTTLNPSFKGQTTLKFKQRDLQQYSSEASSKVYLIDVKLGLQVRAKHGKIKSGQFKPPTIECNRLKVPLRSSSNNGTRVSAKFKRRTCKNVFIVFSTEIDDDIL